MINREELKQYMKRIEPIMDKRNMFLFFPNFKTATYSINMFVLRNRIIGRKIARLDFFKKLDSYSDEEFDKLFKFTIVRNPYDRFLSAFLYLQRKRSIDKNTSFKKFTKSIFLEKGVKFDIHLRVQYRSAFFKNQQYVNFIGKFENLKGDWKYIASKIDCSPDLPHVNKTEHEHYSVYYDQETKEIVEKIYKKDIELFQYGF